MLSKLKLLLVIVFSCILIGCNSISPEQLGISEQQWNKYNVKDQERILSNHKYITEATEKSSFSAYGDSCLILNIQNGKAIMPPFTEWYPFKPVTLKISEGTCQVTELYAIGIKKHVTLCACYNNNVLLLDPSLYEIDKRYGSIRMYYSLLWDDGFNYTNINTDGYARLQKASIFVLKQKNLPPEQCK